MIADEKRFSKIALIALTLCGIGGTAMAFRQILHEARRIQTVSVLPILAKIPDFTLTRETSEPFSRQDLAGKVWIADFVFTSCAGPCPIMTMRMADLQRDLGDEKDVAFVSFSVDPAYDTPKVLRRYGRQYGAMPERWAFLTGDRSRIYDLSINGFKLALGEGEDPEHTILHSTKFVLVDRSGAIRGYYDGTDAALLSSLVADVRTLCREPIRP